MGVNLEKPKVGELCNGCGLCCQIQVCRNGAYVLGLVDQLGETVPGPCPALTEYQGKLQCGVVLKPEKYLKDRPYPNKVLSRNFAFMIGAGNGCDEIGYDTDPEEDRKLKEMYEGFLKDEELMAKYQRAMKVVHGL